MAKTWIVRKDGSPTAYFYWSTTDRSDPTRVPVYKNGSHGVERVRGVFFDAVTNRLGRAELNDSRE